MGHVMATFVCCLSRHIHDKVMAAHQIPEILRVPLKGLVLQVCSHNLLMSHNP